MFLLKRILIDGAQIKQVAYKLFRPPVFSELTIPPPRLSSGSTEPPTPPPMLPSSAMFATGSNSIPGPRKDAPISTWARPTERPLRRAALNSC